MANSTISVEEELFKLEKSSKRVGLRISEGKTKYMVTKGTEHRDKIGQNVTMFNIILKGLINLNTWQLPSPYRPVIQTQISMG